MNIPFQLSQPQPMDLEPALPRAFKLRVSNVAASGESRASCRAAATEPRLNAGPSWKDIIKHLLPLARYNMFRVSSTLLLLYNHNFVNITTCLSTPPTLTMTSWAEVSDLPEVVPSGHNDFYPKVPNDRYGMQSEEYYIDHETRLPTPSRCDVERNQRPRPPLKPLSLQANGFTPLKTQQHQSLILGKCCVCDRSVKVWKCVQCDDSFCDQCWAQQRPHFVSYHCLEATLGVINTYKSN